MIQVFVIILLANAISASPLLKYEKELVKQGVDINVLHEVGFAFAQIFFEFWILQKIAKASREVEGEFGTKGMQAEVR